MSEPKPPSPHAPQRRGPFLARRARWEWHDNVRINILDDNDCPMATLDKWQTLVFHEADGHNSLDMIIDWFPSNYQDPAMVPAEYRRAITQAASFLIDDRHWVDRWDRADDLPDEVALPRSKQTAAGAESSRRG